MSLNIEFSKEDVVYSKIGAALVSAQRVESIAGKLLEFLEHHGHGYSLMTEDFISISEKSKNERKKTLGRIFSLLKLNPKLIISDELDEYARLRNILVHKFYQTHLQTKSNEQMWKVMEFCYAFGRFSNRIEKFFEGFLYFLAIQDLDDLNLLPQKIQDKKSSFDYFIKSLDYQSLQGIEGESIDTFDV